MKKSKWFNPVKVTGWHKQQSSDYRRRLLLSSTDKRKGLRTRRLQAARKALALANVTRDRETARKARSDANYFFNLLKK